MSSSQNSRDAFRSLNLLNLFLLTVHSGLLIFFAVIGITLMAVVNIFSVTFYALGFLILMKGKSTLYIYATLTEIMAHMFLAVICTGWDAGFQLYFIGCIAIVFYADYFSFRMGNQHIKGGSISVVSCGLYLVSLVVTKTAGSLYQMGSGLDYVGQVLNSIVVFTFVTLFLRSQTKLSSYYEEELGRQATHDKLTDMVNRHYLVEQLEGIYTEKKIDSYWIAILDIDNFKGINDRYGHLCGDFVLKTVAGMVKKICGDRTVCRWGGEEFVIVGSDGRLDEKGRRPESVILDNVRRSIAIKDFVYDENTTVNLTVTIGVARYQDGQTVDEWVNVADSRLYRGKQTGKNKVVESDEIPG